jgi:crotonobetaine/carnitine-CoA ligase
MFEVETVVQKHPDVLEVAAFGVVSAELETEAELMVAVAPRTPGALTPEGLARFINDNAPYYFVPRFIDVVEALPRNANGKVVKTGLKDRGPTHTTWDRLAADFTVSR